MPRWQGSGLRLSPQSRDSLLLRSNVFLSECLAGLRRGMARDCHDSVLCLRIEKCTSGLGGFCTSRSACRTTSVSVSALRIPRGGLQKSQLGYQRKKSQPVRCMLSAPPAQTRQAEAARSSVCTFRFRRSGMKMSRVYAGGDKRTNPRRCGSRTITQIDHHPRSPVRASTFFATRLPLTLAVHLLTQSSRNNNKK